MGLLVFSLDDDDLETDLDTPVWDASFREVVRYDALARELDHLVASACAAQPSPPFLGSLVLLATSLRRLAAGAANGTYRELFASDGIIGGYLNAAYAVARCAATRSEVRFDDVLAAEKRLDAVIDELPDELGAPVLETFVALSRFRNDLA